MSESNQPASVTLPLATSPVDFSESSQKSHPPVVIEPAMGIGFRQSPTTSKLTKAIVLFQTKAPVVVKELNNQQTKSNYASLSDIWLAVAPVLVEAKLAAILAPGAIREVKDPNYSMAMCMRLSHESGEFLEHTGEIFVPAPIISKASGAEVTNAAQRLGSAITYMRRYMLVTMLGIILGDDDDAAHAFAQGRTGSKYMQDPEVTEKQGRPWQEQIREGFPCFECIAPHDSNLKMGEVDNKDLPKLIQAEIANGEQNQFVLAEAVRRMLRYSEGELKIAGVDAFVQSLTDKGWTGGDFWNLDAKGITVLRAFFIDTFLSKKGGAQ